MNTKTLCSLGNSKALILDKSIMRLLGIGPKTKLRLMTDGRRLIVEPITEEPPAPTASELDAVRVFVALLDRGMSQSEFDRLHHEKTRMAAYQGHLQFARTFTDTERATMRRFEACLRALRQKASWSDAIAFALHAEPRPTSATTGERPAPPPPAEERIEPVARRAAITHEPSHGPIDAQPDVRTAPLDESLYREDVDEENPVDGVLITLD